jgi:hypothetical protein
MTMVSGVLSFIRYKTGTARVQACCKKRTPGEFRKKHDLRAADGLLISV